LHKNSYKETLSRELIFIKNEGDVFEKDSTKFKASRKHTTYKKEAW
jgi:hypothetical protein